MFWYRGWGAEKLKYPKGSGATLKYLLLGVTVFKSAHCEGIFLTGLKALEQ